MRQLVVFAGTLLVAVPLVAVAEDLNIQPGKWEYKQVTEFEGKMDMPKQRRTTTQCVTASDVEQRSVVPDPKSADCETVSKEISGSSMTHEMSCTDPQGNQTRMQIDMEFNGDQANGTMEMNVQGQPMRMVTTIDARRIGDC